MVNDSGVLEVAIVDQPVRQTSSVVENGATWWLWDYTVTYEDSLFDDPLRPLKNCDIKLACCDDCATLYVKGLLRGYVESVTGNIVDNTDPNNPIVTETLTVLAASGGNLVYTDELGANTTINVCAIVAGCGYLLESELCAAVGVCGYLLESELCAAFAACGIATGITSVVDLGDGSCTGLGLGSIQSLAVVGSTLEILAKPEHTAATYQAAALNGSFNNTALESAIDLTVPPINFSVAAQCREQKLIITVDAGFYLTLPASWGGNFKMYISVDGGAFSAYVNNAFTANNLRTETFDIHSTIIDTIPAGGTRNYAFQLSVQSVVPQPGAIFNNYAYSARALAVA